MVKLTIFYTPDTQLIINEEAFDGKLLNSTIGEKEATFEFDQLTTVRPNAFLNKEKKDPAFIGKAILPDSVTEIWKDSFYCCDRIESVHVTPGKMFITDGVLRVYLDTHDEGELVVPEGVVEIADKACFGCWMKKVVLPATLKRIGNSAFGHCTNLTSVKMAKGLQWIGDECFFNTALGTATIPDTVTSVGERAFADCDKLKKIKFGKNVEVIGKCVLARTPKLAAIDGKFATADKRGLVVGDCFLAYAGADKNEEYTVPENVTRIEDYAFSFSANLKRITLPPALESIGEYAFRNTGVEELDIPESVTELAPAALAASNIMRFHGKYASPDNLYLANDGVLLQMSSAKGYGHRNLIFEVPADIVEIGEWAFFANRTVDKIVWHDGIKRIADHAFQAVSFWFDPQLPAGLEEIGKMAFNDPMSWSIFRGSSIIFPSSVKKIGSSIGLPETLYFEPTVPPEWNAHELEKRNVRTIYVPAESIDAYKEAYPMFAEKIIVWER